MFNRHATEVEFTRSRRDIVEFMVTYNHDGETTTRIYHSNRTTTFHGPHTGSPAHQVVGPAELYWHETDQRVIDALRSSFPFADIRVAEP